MSDEEAEFFADACARMPEYMSYNSELAPTYDEYGELPTHLKLMPLPELWNYLKPGKVFTGTDILFDVDGYARSELFMSIYVRTAHDYPDYFPLIKIRLDGSIIDAIREDNARKSINPFSMDATGLKGVMYGRGAFRSLIAYLESELPRRGFKGVFLEQVHNEHLQSVALRYGFEWLTEPSPICFIKRLAAEKQG